MDKTIIMVVADSAIGRLDTQHSSAVLGICGGEAANGHQAQPLLAVAACQHALILMESNMWHIKRLRLAQKCQSWKELEPGHRTLDCPPAIQIREICLQEGMDDYPLKIYATQALGRVLSK